MSPAKKPPRPVTAWFEVHSAPADEIAVMTGCRKKRNQREVRCRLTPIRPATDAEIERLARKLHDAVFIPSHWDEQGAVARADYRRIARAAWAKGARP